MKIILALTFLFTTACVKISNNRPSDNSDPSEAERSQKSQEIKLLFSKEPNSYQVQIPLESSEQVVRRTNVSSDNSFGESKYLERGDQSDYLIDQPSQLNQKYLYEIGRFVNGSFSANNSFEIFVPVDLVIDNISLTGNTIWNSYRRIYFNSNSVLTTSNYSLTINAQELISENGIIQTFPVSVSNPQGRSGSNIQINLKTAQGSLRVSMRGEKGSKGPSGMGIHCDSRGYSQGGSATDGEPGGNGGNSGQIFIRVAEAHSLQVMLDPKAGEPGDGGDAGITCGGVVPRASGPSGVGGTIQQSCIDDPRGHFCY